LYLLASHAIKLSYKSAVLPKEGAVIIVNSPKLSRIICLYPKKVEKTSFGQKLAFSRHAVSPIHGIARNCFCLPV